VDDLVSGHFDDQLLAQIASRRVFIFICSQGSLDRCVNEGDWVRREIAHALQTRRHIVPLVLPGFVWPAVDALPREMADFQRHNAFEYSHNHWKLIKPKLAEMLRVKPARPSATYERDEPPPELVPPVTVPLAAPAWCEVLANAPDPSVVTDAAARERMVVTKLPWKVRDRKTGLAMLLCPAGEFMMGSPKSEVGRLDDELQQPVSISEAFYLSETEVTQDAWQRLMGDNPSRFKGGNFPVERVSWDGCQRFCRLAGLRLPTEAEWEYACRAGTQTAFSCGEKLDAALVNFRPGSDREVPSRDIERARTVECGSLPANQWGFREMHGNVWEWCEDTYAARASCTQQALTGSVGPRVLRGGGFESRAKRSRSASRDRQEPGRSFTALGFRVARSAVTGGASGVGAESSGAVVIATVVKPSTEVLSPVTLNWCEILASDPDPAVVTAPAVRARMSATKLPWRVRDRRTGIVMLLCPPGEF
jgi:formylglycine-generating enzyme required for sulfatase activity